MHPNTIIGSPTASCCDTIGMLSWAGDVTRDWYGDFCVLSRLHTVAIFYDTTVIDVLRDLPLLVDLELIIEGNITVPRAKAAGFRSLRRLCLRYLLLVYPQSARILRALSTQPLQLQEISYGCAFGLGETVPMLFRTTREYCDVEELTSIVFIAFSMLAPGSRGRLHLLPPSHIALADLLTFSNIQHFEVSNVCHILAPRPRSYLDAMTAAWPNLRSLRLGNCYARLSLECISCLASRCPDLRYLRMQLFAPDNDERPAPLPDNIPGGRYNQMIEFHVGGMKQDECPEDAHARAIAAFICSVFPRLQDFVSWTDMQEEKEWRRGSAFWDPVGREIRAIQRENPCC